MYNYQILITIGIVAAVAFVLLIIYFVASYKKGRLFKGIKSQEIKPFGALSSTMQAARFTTKSVY